MIFLSDRVRHIRKSLGHLSQVEFARRCGASVCAVETWESGRRRPSPKFLRKMAQIAPRFSREIKNVLTNYQWHNGRKKRPRLLVPIKLSAEVEVLAASLGVSTRMALRSSLVAGIAAIKRRGTAKKYSARWVRREHDLESEE